MEKTLRTASVQFQHIPGDKQRNLEVIREFSAQAASMGTELIVFPEMCITGYWHVRNLSRQQITDLAEPIPEGPSVQELLNLSKKYRMTIGAGLIEIDENGLLYNSYVAAMSDGTYACHRKIHCFISEHMESGDSYTVFDTPHGAKMGILTCYDNNIIENVRITALTGAEVLLAPHQTGGCDSTSPRAMGTIDTRLWDQRFADPGPIEAEFLGPKGRGWLMRWLPSRAHDNGIYLVFSNGVGTDDDEVRTGNAMIIDPYGEIMAETWKAGNDMVVADLNPLELPSSTGQRWLKSRRPDLYTPITKPTGQERDTRTVRFNLDM